MILLLLLLLTPHNGYSMTMKITENGIFNFAFLKQTLPKQKFNKDLCVSSFEVIMNTGNRQTN